MTYRARGRGLQSLPLGISNPSHEDMTGVTRTESLVIGLCQRREMFLPVSGPGFNGSSQLSTLILSYAPELIMLLAIYLAIAGSWPFELIYSWKFDMQCCIPGVSSSRFPTRSTSSTRRMPWEARREVMRGYISDMLFSL